MFPPITVLFIFGTRPEAIKLCPVVRHMQSRPDVFRVRICVTAQHRHLLDQVLTAFDISPDYDLDTMRTAQTLSRSTSRILAAVEAVLETEKPDIAVVQGDTTTTFCGALAAFYAGVTVGHVEAGLRTGNPRQPFPEEINRVLTTHLATLHFAPTDRAARNLRNEGVAPEHIFVTGNTAIDAVLQVAAKLNQGVFRSVNESLRLNPRKPLLLVTAHRRESFGSGIENICDAVLHLSTRCNVQIVFPVHPNPNVSGPVTRRLGNRPGITLTAPLTYVEFVDLMQRSVLILTDSGGIQEEAPALHKPVLVMRSTTERPEAVETGLTELVGTDTQTIVARAEATLSRIYTRGLTPAANPFGDGKASGRIAAAIVEYCHGTGNAVSQAATDNHPSVCD